MYTHYFLFYIRMCAEASKAILWLLLCFGGVGAILSFIRFSVEL